MELCKDNSMYRQLFDSYLEYFLPTCDQPDVPHVTNAGQSVKFMMIVLEFWLGQYVEGATEQVRYSAKEKMKSFLTDPSKLCSCISLWMKTLSPAWFDSFGIFNSFKHLQSCHLPLCSLSCEGIASNFTFDWVTRYLNLLDKFRTPPWRIRCFSAWSTWWGLDSSMFITIWFGSAFFESRELAVPSLSCPFLPPSFG